MSTPKAYSYIRFSTSEQKHGHSEQRQIEAAEAYLEENEIDLELDTEFKDEGASGFSGAHKEEGGALGRFLELVDADDGIAEGSLLIVENIDRLGRQEPLDAVGDIKKIVRAGITLVVLERYREDRKITDYTLKNRRGQFQYLAGEIERAYYESKYKSDRLQDAWKEKRKKAKAGKRKLSKICPMWLEPVIKKDKNGEEYVDGYDERDEVVKVIRKMFDMKSADTGNYQIMEELNKKSYPFLEESKRNATGKWAKSTINRYLKDRRLIGEYQPHHKNRQTNEKRKEIKDEVWEDYYPEVIPERLFLEVEAKMEENGKKNIGGPTGKMSNLFRHLVKCAECEGSMHHQNKGNGRRYLRCYKNQKGKCDQSDTFRYDLYFEPYLLGLCKGLTVSTLLPDADQRKKELQRWEKKRSQAGAKLKDVRRKIENFERIQGDTDSLKRQRRYERKLDELDDKEEELTQEIDELDKDIEKMKEAEARTGRRLKDIADLIDQMDEMEGQELIDLRVALNKKLRRLIDRIEVGYRKNIKGNQIVSIVIYFASGEVRKIRAKKGRKLSPGEGEDGKTTFISKKDFPEST